MTEEIHVSAVIPTRNRPEIVCRAVRSALCQTYKNLEIVVVVDGPNPSTAEALAALQEPRLRVMTLTIPVGGSEARNIGVRAARGEWIALLDDDDEWLPCKIATQVAIAQSIKSEFVVIANKYIDRRTSGDMIRPQIPQRPEQHISEYMFCEASFFHPRQGAIQTSTLFVSRSLLLKSPFTAGLKRFQDIDWLLRAVPQTGREVYIAPSILSIYHNDQASGRIGSSTDWHYLLHWAICNRGLFTAKAFSYFLSNNCFQIALKNGLSYSAIFLLIRSCWQYGMFSPKVVWFFFKNAILGGIAMSLFPSWLLKKVNSFVYQ
jgi:glycosyltransferase involved in cell wall biosynthesis